MNKIDYPIIYISIDNIMSVVMYNIPDHIRANIIINSIILTRNKNGWNEIHYQLKKSKTFLKQTSHVFEKSLKYENAIRVPCICLYDVFSLDDNGNYLDDTCDEIIYW
jgi:hypothetical protein